MKNGKVLVIDNIDSFVYNLVQYVGMNGKEPLVLKNTVDYTEVREKIDEGNIAHIIISPGPKTPKEAGISNNVIKDYGPNIPTLGVCLGHQCIGYVYGGTVKRAVKLRHGKTSLIEHDGKDIYKGVKNPFEATRYHSLIIEEKSLPSRLEITARSLDDREIMGVRHRKYPIYGVQFHPESILTGEGMKIIRNFLNIKGGQK
ncbi:MAG: aminodeoxychorismate/anthranilate synthase component II [Candidatus Altiarchaeota archaeon]|nr:aminodeoxychorismate/anthranilate synthase component II [Candidatus Altiarchaeota archaeon]